MDARSGYAGAEAAVTAASRERRSASHEQERIHLFMAAADKTAHDNPGTLAATFPWAGLLILAASIFIMVTSEFLPTGLLPELARSFEVTESQVGMLVTVFAATVVLTAAPLSSLTRRYSRKSLILAVLVIFALGNVLAAIAPSFEVLIAARIVGGLSHGLFWSVVGAYSSYLVPPHQIGRAVAVTSAGGTAAFVLGVPLGTALGHAVGWRLSFAVIAAVVLVLVVLVVRFLPAVQHGEQLATGEISLPARKDRTLLGVVFACLFVIVIVGAQQTFYTYIAPYLIDVGNFEEASVALLLFLYGGAGAIGLVVAGFASDRFPRSGLVAAVAVVALAVLGMGLAPGQGVLIVSIIIWGLAFGGVPAMLQTRLLRTASPRIRDVSAAWFTTSFNIAIGGGAFVGGTLLDRFGVEVLPFVTSAVVLAGVALILLSDLALRRQAKVLG